MTDQVLSIRADASTIPPIQDELAGTEMTVCVAAICNGNAVIGMSDRMLTSGDTQFSPPRSKVFPITSSIVAMISGDLALASELLSEVKGVVDARIAKAPKEWWYVREVANLWCVAHRDRFRRESEAALLAPLGLTSETYISRQNELAESLTDKLASELINYQLPGIDIIFAGIDHNGPHLYVSHCGSVAGCSDAIGFASVGSGAYHARSQFMFSGHTSDSPLHKSLYTTYAAKRRAEVAPGVGKDTDTFIIWQLGGSAAIREDILVCVRDAYNEAEQESAEIANKIEGKLHGAIQDLLKEPSQNQGVTKSSDGVAPADGEKD